MTTPRQERLKLRTEQITNMYKQAHERALEVMDDEMFDEHRAKARTMKTSELLQRVSGDAQREALVPVFAEAASDEERIEAMTGLLAGTHILYAEIDRRMPVPESPPKRSFDPMKFYRDLMDAKTRREEKARQALESGDHDAQRVLESEICLLVVIMAAVDDAMDEVPGG